MNKGIDSYTYTVQCIRKLISIIALLGKNHKRSTILGIFVASAKLLEERVNPASMLTILTRTHQKERYRKAQTPRVLV